MPTGNIRIRRLSPNDFQHLAEIYCICFAGKPWFEVYQAEEVADEIKEVYSWKDAVMVVAEVNDVVVGAAWSFSVWRKPDVMALVNMHPIFPYISEIFVSPEHQGQGIAKRMVDRLLDCLVDIRFGVVRTSVNQPIIIRMFEGFGWKIVATENVVSNKCLNGVVQSAPDKRVILAGRIPNS